MQRVDRRPICIRWLTAYGLSTAPWTQGFTLQEADVDRVVQAAREIEGAQVAVDPNYPPQQSIDTLLRVIRLLQSAIDVQFSEVEDLTNDFNELQARGAPLLPGVRRGGETSDTIQAAPACT